MITVKLDIKRNMYFAEFSNLGIGSVTNGETNRKGYWKITRKDSNSNT